MIKSSRIEQPAEGAPTKPATKQVVCLGSITPEQAKINQVTQGVLNTPGVEAVTVSQGGKGHGNVAETLDRDGGRKLTETLNALTVSDGATEGEFYVHLGIGDQPITDQLLDQLKERRDQQANKGNRFVLVDLTPEQNRTIQASGVYSPFMRGVLRGDATRKELKVDNVKTAA